VLEATKIFPTCTPTINDFLSLFFNLNISEKQSSKCERDSGHEKRVGVVCVQSELGSMASTIIPKSKQPRAHFPVAVGPAGVRGVLDVPTVIWNVCFFLLAFSLAIFGRSVLTQSGADLGSIFPDREGSVVSKEVASIAGIKGHLIGHRVVRRINTSPLNVLTSKAL
jgi:hypothetical protein